MQVSRSNVVTWFTCSACCMRHTALLLGFFEDMLARQSLWKRPDSFVLSSLRVIKAKLIRTMRCHFPVSIFLFRVPESPSDFKSPQIKCSITFFIPWAPTLCFLSLKLIELREMLLFLLHSWNVCLPESTLHVYMFYCSTCSPPAWASGIQ